MSELLEKIKGWMNGIDREGTGLRVFPNLIRLGMNTEIHGKLKVNGVNVPVFVPLTTPLTGANWNGDSYSTVAKTLIDLSAEFGVPAGVKAVAVSVLARDSGSASAACNFQLAPNNTANQAALWVRLEGLVNDKWTGVQGIVPCNTDGDIYYQVLASGASTLDVFIEIWGYWM